MRDGVQRAGVHAELAREHGTAGDVLWTALIPIAVIAIPLALAAVANPVSARARAE
jgi:hypothetical protein